MFIQDMLEYRIINFSPLKKGKHHFFYLLQINYDLRGFALQQHNIPRGNSFTSLQSFKGNNIFFAPCRFLGGGGGGGGGRGGLEKTAIISTKVHHLYDHYKNKNHGCIN